MFFYKATGILNDEKWIKENNDRMTMHKRARNILYKTEDFNQKMYGTGYCFVASIDDERVEAGLLSQNKCADKEFFYDFMQKVGIDISDICLEEITIKSMINMTRYAHRNDYIRDDDQPFEIMRISGLNQFFRMDYDEKMLDENTAKERLYSLAKDAVAEETLAKELHRIYSGKNVSIANGHPVHYIVEADKSETKTKLAEIALQALYDNARIGSRRYLLVEMDTNDRVSGRDYDLLYRACGFGAVIVKYNARSNMEDDEYANSDIDKINLMCETMKKYRNKVLTIFCFPRACGKLKELFFERLGSVSFVEISEDTADYTRACMYLKDLSRKNGVRADKDLLGSIEADRVYLPDEMDTLFDEWYSKKLKTKVFPQYNDIASCSREVFKEKPKGSTYDELDNMIGLAEAKAVINKAVNYYKLQKICKDKGLNQDRVSMHMVFTGNPGTAKTTVARLFARIMKENGLLSKGQLVEVGRGDLVGKYVGWTATIVKKRFEEAKGGVLFIDEAYSLVDDRGGSFGDEAINTIVQEMENNREDLVVIFAGYPKEMDAFIRKNPGLRSRIAFHVPFSDYDTAELCEIAKYIGDSKGITFTERAMDRLTDVFESARKQDDFGNGRYVRNIIEISRMNQASRIALMDFEKITKKVLTSIDEQDIEIPAISKPEAKRHIGFAC